MLNNACGIQYRGGQERRQALRTLGELTDTEPSPPPLASTLPRAGE
jgi:hypothetical protein